MSVKRGTHARAPISTRVRVYSDPLLTFLNKCVPIQPAKADSAHLYHFSLPVPPPFHSSSQASGQQDLHPSSHLRGPQPGCQGLRQGDRRFQYSHRKSHRSWWVGSKTVVDFMNNSRETLNLTWFNSNYLTVADLYGVLWVRFPICLISGTVEQVKLHNLGYIINLFNIR